MHFNAVLCVSMRVLQSTAEQAKKAKQMYQSTAEHSISSLGTALGYPTRVKDVQAPSLVVTLPALAVPHHQQSANQSQNSLIQYCNTTKDFMVPSLWGQVCLDCRVSTSQSPI